ncbi:hypothetical protein AV521_17495 [Streptomyces sp. IMTB 2501]|uniref:hypothetical protein n=1 Tax=Streptomyces sp. IMTB 2501 TaxID=1776340 RepID=UPI00096FF99D|nr:hypothetical protein [Streptomyces sp. IMTB 2501]OLZ69332.1 hypothetical protein AV521_17495 [Streptomyces sp. IMTB 2501]
MNLARTNMVAAAVGAAAALVATGITYASAASDPAPAAAPMAAASAPRDGGTQSKGNEGGREEEGRGGREGREGRIQINERSYSSHPGDCITVVSGLGAKTLNIRNDSHKTVEVFRGAVCDNGGPIATVGPHSDSFGVRACPPEGIEVENGVIASFRVVRHHED